MDKKIVSTTYAPLQPPFQIIKYGTELGMQIGTLIVTIQKEGGKNRLGYEIETHSHPVVSYENKYTQKPDTQLFSHQIMEGAVWNYVELKDITTVCLSNFKMPWGEFIAFLWNDHMRLDESSQVQYNIYWQLKRLGVEVERPNIKAYNLSLHTITEKDGVMSVRTGRDDMFAVNVPWNENATILAEKIKSVMTDYQFIIYDGRSRSQRPLVVAYHSDEDILADLVKELNTPPKGRTLVGSFTIQCVPPPYEEAPSGNE